MNANKILEIIKKSPMSEKFDMLPERDKTGIVSDYRVCADAVSLIIALWNDRRIQKI